MKSPSQISFRLINRSFTDHLTLYLLFPHIVWKEDLDYDTIERGTKEWGISLDTKFRVSSDRDHASMTIRVLGFGFTLVRQWSY